MQGQLQQQLHAQQQQLAQQQAQFQQQLQARDQQQQQREQQQQQARDERDKDRELHLSDDVRADFVPHLQLDSIEASERKKILRKYPKSDDLPQQLRDDSGIAAKALGDNKDKRWLITELPKYQKDAIDVLRIAATARVQAATYGPDQGPQAIEFLLDCLRDITIISCDNAQRFAETQIKGVFDSTDAKGALTLVKTNLDGPDCDIDPKEHTILQQAHLDAITELRKFSSQLGRGNSNGGGRGKGNGHGGKGGWQRNFGRGGGKGKGGKGGGGYGGWQQRPYNNWNQNSNGKGKGGKGGGGYVAPSPGNV